MAEKLFKVKVVSGFVLGPGIPDAHPGDILNLPLHQAVPLINAGFVERLHGGDSAEDDPNKVGLVTAHPTTDTKPERVEATAHSTAEKPERVEPAQKAAPAPKKA